jgi:hypothetical protein
MIAIRVVACQGVGDLSTRRAALCHSRMHVEVRKLDFVGVATIQGRDVNGTEKVSGRAGRALQWDGGRVGDCDTERRSVRIKRAAGALVRRLWVPPATGSVDE